MGNVNVKFNGKDFLLSCEDGQEEHLEELSLALNKKFNSLKDLNELAIGSGFGVRYDSGLFVFRLDMGLKTYNPALEKNRRWFKDFSLKKGVFNIGLNYPF